MSTALALQREPVTFKDDIRQFVMKGDDTEKVDVSLAITDTAITLSPKRKSQSEISDPIRIDFKHDV